MKKHCSYSAKSPFRWSLPLSSLVITSALILASCHSPKAAPSGPLTVKVEFIDQRVMEEIEQHISSFEVVPMEYSKGQEIGAVSKIAGDRKKVACFIWKDKSIWITDYKGRILSKIASKGKGPGEYINVADIEINPAGNLVVLDTYKKALLEYSTEGICLSERGIPGNFENIAFLGNGKLVFGAYRVAGNDSIPGYYVQMANENLDTGKKMLPFYTDWPMGGARPDLFAWNGNIGIDKVGDYHYYRLHDDGRLDTVLIFDFGANGYDFSNGDRMSMDDYLQIMGENMAKPISAGLIIPQKYKYLSTNFLNGSPYIVVAAWDQELVTYRPVLDFKFIGTYKGFPVPMAREIVDGRIAGSFEAADILGFWERYPEQKIRAQKEPEFRKIMEDLDLEDNPVLVFFTLGK